VTSAIIVAAGQSTRMGPRADKLFLPVAGRPLLAYAWQRFDSAPFIGEIVLVAREGLQSVFADLAGKFGFTKPFRVVPGGKQRQDSVWNGLEALSPESDIVAIQDAARPCTSLTLIEATVEAARQHGAAVAAQPVTDTIKWSDDGAYVSRHLDRSRLWAVQTPQTFRVAIIRRALQAVRERGAQVTDDTAACELIGQPVKLVHVPGPNPKVTVPGDVPCVEILLRGQ
jgi:2-C-methyl-D-erythritol 4-phosphate cytidylyltransferase